MSALLDLARLTDTGPYDASAVDRGVVLLARAAAERSWHYLHLLTLAAAALQGKETLLDALGASPREALKSTLIYNHRVSGALRLTLDDAGGGDDGDSWLNEACDLFGADFRLPARLFNFPWTDRWYHTDDIVALLAGFRSLGGSDEQRAAAMARRLRGMNRRMQDAGLMRLQTHAAALSEPRWRRLARASPPGTVHLRIHYSTAIITISVMVDRKVWKRRKLYIAAAAKALSDAERERIDQHFAARRLAQDVYETIHALRRQGDPDSARPMLSRFYDLLLREALDRPEIAAREGATLIVATHGVLAHLPFAALHDGQRYLIERFDVVQAAIFHGAKFGESDVEVDALTGGSPVSAGAPFRAMVNPNLDHADEEREALREVGVVPAPEGAADWTAAMLKRFLAAPGIAVLSTHMRSSATDAAKTDIETPQRQWIPFAEVLDRQSDADLVVLAGCNSMANLDWFSDDENNLTATLLEGGTRSVIATAWPADDLACVLYNKALLKGLRAGLTRARAHSEAQRIVMRVALPDGNDRLVAGPERKAGSAAWHAPRFWAPFVLSGAWR